MARRWTSWGSTPRGELFHLGNPPSALGFQRTIAVIMNRRTMGVTVTTCVKIILGTVNEEMVVTMAVASVFRGSVNAIVVP